MPSFLQLKDKILLPLTSTLTKATSNLHQKIMFVLGAQKDRYAPKAHTYPHDKHLQWPSSQEWKVHHFHEILIGFISIG